MVKRITVITDERIEKIKREIRKNPKTTIEQLAALLDISSITLKNTLKKSNFNIIQYRLDVSKELVLKDIEQSNGRIRLNRIMTNTGLSDHFINKALVEAKIVLPKSNSERLEAIIRMIESNPMITLRQASELLQMTYERLRQILNEMNFNFRDYRNQRQRTLVEMFLDESEQSYNLQAIVNQTGLSKRCVIKVLKDLNGESNTKK